MKNTGQKIFNKYGVLLILICFSAFLFVCNVELISVWNGNASYIVGWIYTDYYLVALANMLLMFLAFYFLTGNFFAAFIIIELLTLVWGLVDRVVFKLRFEYITVADLLLAEQATKIKFDLADLFSFIEIFLILVSALWGCLWLFATKKYSFNLNIKNYKHTIYRCVGLVISIILLFVIYCALYPGLRSNNSTYVSEGAICTFMNSLFDNSSVSESIDAEQLLDEVNEKYSSTYVEKDDEIVHTPNIIVIMSEAFWNIDNVAEKNDETDCIVERFYSIMKEGISGSVAVNVYGGGTNASEFEFLSGINPKYLQTTDYYSTVYKYNQTSFASYLNNLGYNTIALHPYDGIFWARKSGYPNVGFDESLFIDDFQHKSMWKGLVSDEEFTDELILRFEDKKAIDDSPVFLFGVSIQNHIIRLDGSDESQNSGSLTLDEYYEGLSLTLDSLEYLISYFEDYDEDMMIVFFGDHAPSMAQDVIDESQDKDSLFMTPYFIWTNYDNDYTAYGDMNLSYLSTVIMTYLNMPPTKYYYYNYEMWKAAPINTKYLQVLGGDSGFFDEEELRGLGRYIENASKVGPMTIDFWEI